MTFDFAAYRRLTQRVVHDTLSFPVEYTSPGGEVVVTLRVRRHNKQVLDGNLLNEGFASVIEGINSIIFDSEELAEKGITLERGGKVTFDDGSFLSLDSQPPSVLPIGIAWRVV